MTLGQIILDCIKSESWEKLDKGEKRDERNYSENHTTAGRKKMSPVWEK